ncbi:hypothetical protein AB0C90_03555 [Streptomyces sp. NPDC048550]|uniref:hypothetical protein n=1 Tax=unclassified Streptomyces TaxID=2593676 RepID=UPI003447B36C
MEIQAPGVCATRLREALLANPEARERLGGGSDTVGGRLVLITPIAGLPLARRLTAELGVDWPAPTCADVGRSRSAGRPSLSAAAASRPTLETAAVRGERPGRPPRWLRARTPP